MFIISKHSALSSTRQDVFLILTASAAVPPRTQSAAQLPSTAPHDSKARLRAVTSSRDSWRSHVHRARLRSACSSSSTRPAMSGVEGDAPCLSLGDSKGVFSSKREYPLWCRGAHAAPPSRANAGKRMQRCRAAIESPAPYRRKKGAALSGCINSPRPLGAKKAALARGNKKRSLFRGSFFSGISHYIQRSY